MDVRRNLMTSEMKLLQVPSHSLAIVRRKVPQASFPQVIPDAFTEVWNFLRASGIENDGINVVVYRHDHDDLFDIECGFRVSQPFEPSSQVISSHTPAGLAARTMHDRPYTQLPETHSALRRWAMDQGKTLAGVSWEIYDHWTPEVPEPSLEIFYLLRD
jgi:effector-binding domain-containing protein